MNKYLRVFLLLATIPLFTIWWAKTTGLFDELKPRVPTSLLTLSKLVSRATYEDPITIVMVACGDINIKQVETSLKSAILSGIYNNLTSLQAILFTDDNSKNLLTKKVENLKTFSAPLKFNYEVHPTNLPEGKEWHFLYKRRPCATQRLFLHNLLPSQDKVLYLDADTLVLGNIQKLWDEFEKMNSSQIFGVTMEDNFGWYPKLKYMPFYPPSGINSGVMLTSLKRIREELEFTTYITKAFKKYKPKMRLTDQDLLNVYFHDKPELVYILPCYFNYRTDHCIKKWICDDANNAGIQILHGNRHVFGTRKTAPAFKMAYEKFEKFKLGQEDYIKDLVIPLKQEMQILANKSKKGCSRIATEVFKFYD